MATMLMVAAFAGVLIIADDGVDATESEFTVTYSYDGSSIVKKMSEGNKVTFEGALSFTAPEGYEFEKTSDDKMVWKDVASGAKYVEGQDYSFSANIVVEPITQIASGHAEITLTDGENAKIFLVESGSDSGYTLTDGMIETYLKSIGLKIDGGSIVGDKAGFKFGGFFKDGAGNAIFAIGDLTGVEKTNTTYVAKFTPIYKVSFNVEGAETLSITNGEIVLNDVKDADGTTTKSRTIPVAPVKENYIFMGWYNAADEKIIGYSVDKDEYTYAVDGFEFTADTALFAKFVPLTYTVTFVYGEEKAVFTTETVKYGEKAIEPKGLPEGYKGWDFDFSQAILADTEIVAIVADPVTVYDVTFEVEGKTPNTQKSDNLTIPDTAREGYVFQGWVVKGQTEYVNPLNYDIQSDITFVAVYKTADPPAGPGFFETNEGKCVAVIIGVVLIAFVYAVYTNMFGMKDLLTSFKVQRVKKE